MSQYLNQIAVTQFDTMTKHDYQAEGVLRGLFRQRPNVTGSKITFNKMGKGMANKRTAPSSDVIAMNVDHNKVECNLEDWEASEYTDIFKQKEVLPDEVSELAYTIKSAIGRRRDQIAIDALSAGDYSATPSATQGMLIGTDIGGTSTNMNLEKLLAIKAYMDRKSIPKDGRCIAVHSDGLTGLLNETKTTSSDYNTVQALVRGEIDTFLGFKFVYIPDMEEGGLSHNGSGTYPVAGDVVDGFAFHKVAVGEAIGIEMQTAVDWIPNKKSYLSSGDFKGGAVIIDNTAVVKIQYTI